MSHKAISFLSAGRGSDAIVLSWYKARGPFFSQEPDPEFSQFTVYRKECPDFEFNHDYQEYFCGLREDDADLLFRGALECTNNRKFTYRDDTARAGCTYAYFVRSKTSQAVGPLPVKMRDPGVWWSYQELDRRIDRLCQKYPSAVSRSVCGKTVQGREIFALQAGSGRPFLGLTGAVHAGEAGPELIILALEKLLEAAPEALQHRSIAIIPSLNIDQREQLWQGVPWYLRTNAAGVDLNRNFPADWDSVAKGYGLSSDDRDSMTFRGSYPASEPETRAAIDFFTTTRPKCIFNYHALAGICDLPAVSAGGVDISNHSFYASAKAFAYAYGKGLHPQLPPEESWLSFKGSEGSMTRWCWQALKIPGFDLELSRRIAPEALQICQTDRTTPALVQEYAEKHARAIKNILWLKE